jgi:hypothetical protein
MVRMRRTGNDDQPAAEEFAVDEVAFSWRARFPIVLLATTLRRSDLGATAPPSEARGW